MDEGERRLAGIDLPHRSQVREVAGVEVTLLAVDDGRWEVFAEGRPVGALRELSASREEPWRQFAASPAGDDSGGATDDWRAAVAYLLRAAADEV